jgi:aminoglycoside 6'-N-acetyltransferase
MRVGFRPLARDDLALLHQWLQREHVRRWWSKHETYEDVVEHYLPAVEGQEPTDLYFIVLDGRPAGFIQTYIVSGYPEYQQLVAVEDGVAGVDLFLAAEELMGRGVGSRVLAKFVSTIVFSAPSTSACIADPDAENAASLRAFEKAGFRRVRRFVDPSDGRVHQLVRLDRHGDNRSTTHARPTLR